MNKYQEALNKITFTIADLSSADEGWIKDSEAVKTIQELVDKATPKKPIVESSGDFNGVPVYDEYYCPSCGERVDDTDHHCECGQRLDWSDEE